MPTHKPNLQHLSISQLAGLTGFAKETISARLREAGLEPARKDNRTLWFSSRRALRVLFDAGEAQRERARFDRARARLAELEHKRRAAELVPAEDQDRAVIALATTVSSRLQGIAVEIAPELAVDSTTAGCERTVAAAIERALHDLADAGAGAIARAAGAAS